MAEVTETELAILEVLWDRGASAIREIVTVLYDQHTPALHATVKSLLERLEGKGYVECDKRGFAHTFSALVSREAYVGRQLTELANSHYGGELTPMLLTLVERAELSKKDREAIRKIISGME
jgi:BlaI family transcriptional regulator, penicillinase repressor